MTTVTGLTAARMLEIEAESIVDGDVDGSGHLILTRHDGTTIDAGSVTGPVGPAGPVGSLLSVLAQMPILDVGVPNQIRAGRQLSPADFANLGLAAPSGLWNLSDLTDASGAGRSLLNKGAVLFDKGINGLSTTAAKFAGSTAQALYIADTGAADPFRIKTGSFGIWFRSAKRGVAQTIISKYSASQPGYAINLGTTNVVTTLINITGVAGDITISGQSDVVDNKWHLAVSTFDGALFKLYVDSVLESIFPVAGLIFGSSAPLNVGGFGADGSTVSGNPLFGRADEAFVTPDVLNEDEIRNLFCAKVAHTLGATPSRASINIRRRRKGASLVTADFTTQPLRMHNFSAGSLGDEGSNSLTGAAKPLVAVGGGTITSVAGADGLQGNAMSFMGAHTGLGSTDGSGLPSAEQLPSGTNSRSWGCWFKSQAIQAQQIMGWGTPATADSIYISAAGYLYGIAGGADQIPGANTDFVADGIWHFLVTVVDNAAEDGLKRKIYLDGKVHAATTALSAALALGGANRFRVGAHTDGSSPFVGQIDVPFICGYAMTPEDILTLMTKSSQGLAPSPKNPGDHVEAMSATDLLVAFDSLDPQHRVDLGVAA